MKHRRPFATPQQLLPRKEKDMLKIIKDPNAFKRVMELQKAAVEAHEKTVSSRALGWKDWSARAIQVLPEKFKDNEEISKKIEDFAELLRGDYDDTPDELKTSDE